MKKRILLHQDKHLIERRIQVATKAGNALREKILKISVLIGELPTIDELQDFFEGGSLLSEKIERSTIGDSVKFSSTAGKQIITGSLENVKAQLKTLQDDFRNELNRDTLQPILFEMDHEGRLTPLQSWIDEVIESHTIRATPGSDRYRAFTLSKTVIETLSELKDLLRKHKVENLAAVSTPANFANEGLVYCDDDLNPSIQTEWFDSIPDEVLTDNVDQ